MAFISFNTRVAEHRTRLVCLGESPSPRVRCRLALFTYLLTMAAAGCGHRHMSSGPYKKHRVEPQGSGFA